MRKGPYLGQRTVVPNNNKCFARFEESDKG
jgi:hypothetical protein